MREGTCKPVEYEMDINNPYKDDIDFAALAIQDPDFSKVYVNLLMLSPYKLPLSF
jgi:hypothetical protein